jgi:hypothetical protein
MTAPAFHDHMRNNECTSFKWWHGKRRADKPNIARNIAPRKLRTI